MHNCSAAVQAYHEERAKLSQTKKGELTKVRDIFKTKVETQQGTRSPVFNNQGSYVMNTMIQTQDDDYDIDVGVAFELKDLLKENGALMQPHEAREMMLKVAQDARFAVEPEIHDGKCVRIYYSKGYHVDVPVYRILENGTYEVAINNSWQPSGPEAITKWFQSNITKYGEDGWQVRDVTRSLKKIVESIQYESGGTNKMPSGFVLTVLVCEAFEKNGKAFDRIDCALHGVMKLIHKRMQETGFAVHNPILPDKVISDDTKMVNFFLKLGEILGSLEILFNPSLCNNQVALEAWGKCFKDEDFFKSQLQKSVSSILVGTTPTRPAYLAGDDRKG